MAGSYLNTLSPETLNYLKTNANSHWTDPNSGYSYYGSWSPGYANEGGSWNDPTFMGQIYGESGDTFGKEGALSTGSRVSMPMYDPTTGAYMSSGTGYYGGVPNDAWDMAGYAMGALVGGAGIGAAAGVGGLGAGGASGLEGLGTSAGLGGSGGATGALGIGAGSGAGLASGTAGALTQAASNPTSTGTNYGLSTGGNAGQGLTANTGSGLNLASTTGGPGFNLGTGSGLTLADTTGTGLGLNSATAGNAVLDAAGLTGGLANGSGTLLPPSITNTGYTMADGTIIPNTTSTGIPGSVPSTSGTNLPSTGGVPTSTGTGSGTTGTGGNLNLGNLVGLLSGIYGMNQQNNAANNMLDYLKQRQSYNDNMYNPGSPEYNALWDQMSRNDAAAGRNSQYGPRSVDLAAKVAQLKMNANTQLTSNIAKYMADSYLQRANAGTNVSSALGNILGGSNGSGLSLSQLTNLLNGIGSNSSLDPSTWDWTGATSGTDVGGQVGTDFWGELGI